MTLLRAAVPHETRDPPSPRVPWGGWKSEGIATNGRRTHTDATIPTWSQFAFRCETNLSNFDGVFGFGVFNWVDWGGPLAHRLSMAGVRRKGGGGRKLTFEEGKWFCPKWMRRLPGRWTLTERLSPPEQTTGGEERDGWRELFCIFHLMSLSCWFKCFGLEVWRGDLTDNSFLESGASLCSAANAVIGKDSQASKQASSLPPAFLGGKHN